MKDRGRKRKREKGRAKEIGQCGKLLTNVESTWKIYDSVLYYSNNFSVNLKFQNKFSKVMFKKDSVIYLEINFFEKSKIVNQTDLHYIQNTKVTQ